MKIALLGTRGAPARYSGFETAVEEVGAGLVARGHEVTVYCRGGSGGDAPTYRGMTRVVLPALHRRALETLSHTGLSAIHTMAHRPDVAFVFNAANAPFVAALGRARIPTALHIDGHDSRRAKWSAAGQRYYSWATRYGSRVAARVVVDSLAIRDELEAAHGIRADFIPYGARESTLTADQVERQLATIGLAPDGYHLVVARFEPENHVVEIIEGYTASRAALPLVVVGFQRYPGAYAARIATSAAADERVRLLGAVWDQDLLDSLYRGAVSYLHGHSVGGTNPSLLRAMAQRTPVVALDCPYNRETTGGHALWMQDPRRDLPEFVEKLEAESDPWRVDSAYERVATMYRWEDVVDDYHQLASTLAELGR